MLPPQCGGKKKTALQAVFFYGVLERRRLLSQCLLQHALVVIFGHPLSRQRLA
jgi:hypothetical protein